MENFTPVSALIGGALIGTAAVILMGVFGRIAGISGILHGALSSGGWERSWRLAFLVGLIGLPVVYSVVLARPAVEIDGGWGLVVLAGLIVGIGTRLGSGCTSGHGVCGLSRLSIRSLAATATFMAAGVATVAIVRHLLGQGA